MKHHDTVFQQLLYQLIGLPELKLVRPPKHPQFVCLLVEVYEIVNDISNYGLKSSKKILEEALSLPRIRASSLKILPCANLAIRFR